MSAQLDEKHRQQAILITAGFAGLMIIIMFLLKWDFPTIEKIAQDPGIEVELNLPEEPPVPETQDDGGGGGGNPVQAAGPAGIAPETPPAPGTPDDSKDLEEDDIEDFDFEDLDIDEVEEQEEEKEPAGSEETSEDQNEKEEDDFLSLSLIIFFLIKYLQNRFPLFIFQKYINLI